MRIEDKGPIAAFHWRGVPDEEAALTHLEGLAQEAEAAGLAIHWGRKVLEVRPPVPIDKGQAVRDLVTGAGLRAALYGGDDATDLDGFEALDQLEARGRPRRGRARGRALRRGARGDRGARRPGGGRRGRIHTRAGGARGGLMRFRDFLRTAVLLFGGAATALAAVAVVGAGRNDDSTLVFVALGWWLLAAASRPVDGSRRHDHARHRRAARRRPARQHAARVRARHDPLQPALAARPAGRGRRARSASSSRRCRRWRSGYALLVALLWRKQSAAVEAIEGRDGVEFWIDRTSPFGPPRLLRLPGLRKIEPEDEAPGLP